MASPAAQRRPAAVVHLRAAPAPSSPPPETPAAPETVVAARAERTCFVPDEVRRAVLELEAEAGRACSALSRHFTTPGALAQAAAGLARLEAHARAARRALKRR